MFARKLGRLAGLVFVLAAIVGGTAGGVAYAADSSAVAYSTLDFNWD
ncbi:hypothetical protein [Actinoplanes sp. NPDC020271]